MSTRIYNINSLGKLSNVGRKFKSYDIFTVLEAGKLLLEDAKLVKVQVKRRGYDFLTTEVAIFVHNSETAFDQVVRVLDFLGVDQVPGFVWVGLYDDTIVTISDSLKKVNEHYYDRVELIEVE